MSSNDIIIFVVAGVALDCAQLTESQRIDFVLREGSMESSYISALTSHTSYWSNFDVAHFLLTALYPHLQTCSATSTTAAAATVPANGGGGGAGLAMQLQQQSITAQKLQSTTCITNGVGIVKTTVSNGASHQ